jgi:hypothetical protein
VCAQVLFTLDFGLARPTALRFLHYLLQLAPLPADRPGQPTGAAGLAVARLAEALLELSLADGELCGAAPPSALAAGALYLALGLVQHNEGLPGMVLLSATEPALLESLVTVSAGRQQGPRAGRAGVGRGPCVAEPACAHVPPSRPPTPSRAAAVGAPGAGRVRAGALLAALTLPGMGGPARPTCAGYRRRYGRSRRGRPARSDLPALVRVRNGGP